MESAPVLFLPIIEWEFRRQRPQHLARCFARAGARVYYPDLAPRPDPPPPRLAESGIWRLALAGEPGLDPYRDRLGPGAVERALGSLAGLGPEHPLDGCWVVAQLPFWRPLAEAARAAFGGALLFDCMDDFSAFADHGDLSKEETALAAAADLVAVTAERLRARLAPHARRIVVVHNGCEPDHFGPAAAARAAVGERPVVGFFGGIHEWFDGPLVEELARSRPGWDFWLVGDTYRGEVEGLRRLPNVTFWGEMAYADLPRLASRFDVGIIPFRVTPLTEATDPVKAYEMLAAGLPVVATDLPELRRISPPVALARGAGQFAARIEEALAEPAAAALARREFARGHSWVERFLTLRRAMAEARPQEQGRGAPAAAAASPTRRALSLTHRGQDAADLERRLDQLEAALAHGEGERARLEAERVRLEEHLGQLAAERLSLIEQRDRVQGEAARLSGELARVESERLALSDSLRRITASRWHRLGERYWALRTRLRRA
jgi:glycosyltransferase involved in cell wall biosynthesis